MREVAVILAVQFVLAGAAGYDEPAARKLFESKCGVCHPAEWALEQRKTKAGWIETVERMRRKTAGNSISNGDASVIVEYLVRTRGR